MIANGSLHETPRAEQIVADGHVDLISLGRATLTHADFPVRLGSGQTIEEFDRGILPPLANLAS